MKKILSFITIALLALTCTACGEASESSNVSSTPDVKFTVEDSGDGVYFLRSDNDNCNIRISFSDYGKNITYSFVTDGSDDVCYYVLLNALKSELFGISLDDQIDILAHYKVDEINYSGSSVRITETVKDNIRVIGMRMN